MRLQILKAFFGSPKLILFLINSIDKNFILARIRNQEFNNQLKKTMKTIKILQLKDMQTSVTRLSLLLGGLNI